MRTVGVSIPIPEPYGEFLQRQREAFGDSRATLIPAHITILGPTEVSDTDIDALDDHLAHVAAQVAPFDVLLRGTGSFRPVSDVVFVQVARGISGCEALEGLTRSGRWHRPMPFPYHPHVTIAHDVAVADLDRAFDALADYRAEFAVDAIHLWDQDPAGLWRSVTCYHLTGEAG